MNTVDLFISNRNKFGAVTDTGGVSDNDVLWSAIYVYMLSLKNELAYDSHRLDLVFEKYLDQGLTKRNPDSSGCDAPDNLIGWCVMGQCVSQNFAIDILKYIRCSGGVWPGPEPETKRWLGRFKGITATLQLVAGEKLQYDEIFWLCLSIVASALSKDNMQDNVIEGTLLKFVLGQQKNLSPWVKSCLAMWDSVMAKRGLTLKSVLLTYGDSWKKFADQL